MTVNDVIEMTTEAIAGAEVAEVVNLVLGPKVTEVVPH
jgi:hypothetical protein